MPRYCSKIRPIYKCATDTYYNLTPQIFKVLDIIRWIIDTCPVYQQAI